ncbi:Uma2 family endonuclease [candidate division KSB1 bacterium]|nr:Uma2 family endonuclease [candidate division KSB1 bacterium]
MEVELLTPTAPSRTPSVKRTTFDEYLDLLTEESKGDLIEGVLYMQSPPSDEHEKIFVFLIGILDAFVVRKKLGIVRGSRTAIKFSGYNGTQPDIVFISNARRHLVNPYYMDGAPEVAVEILSPSTRKLDRGKKMALYAEHGVLELWQFDPEEQTAEFFQNDNGTWTPMPVSEDGIFHSKAIPGFWLNVLWLFAEEQPDRLDTVMMILTGTHKGAAKD